MHRACIGQTDVGRVVAVRDDTALAFKGVDRNEVDPPVGLHPHHQAAGIAKLEASVARLQCTQRSIGQRLGILPGVFFRRVTPHTDGYN